MRKEKEETREKMEGRKRRDERVTENDIKYIGKSEREEDY